MKYLQFSSKQLLLPLITVVFLFARRLFSSMMLISIFMESFFGGFPLLFSIFTEIFIKARIHRQSVVKQTKEIQQINIISAFERVENERLFDIKKVVFFIITGLCRFIIDILNNFILMYKSNGLSNIISFSCLFVTWLMCYLSSKIKLARHHALGLGIVLLSSIIEIFYLSKNWQGLTEYYGLGVTIVCLILFIGISSAKEISEKHLMTTYFYSSNILLFSEGVMSLVIFAILLLTTSFIDCSRLYFEKQCIDNQWKNFIKGFNDIFNYSSIVSLYAWLVILFHFISSTLLIEMNKSLTPMHKYIPEALVQVAISFYTIIIWFSSKDLLYILESALVIVLLSLISLIGCFTFNEYIILRCFSLHKDTKLAIEQRAMEDHVYHLQMSAYINEEDCLAIME